MSSRKSAEVDDGAQGASPGELGRLARPVESCRRPQSVEILVDETGGSGHPPIEAVISGHVVKRQGQPTLSWPQRRAKQPIERNRAADLVAVGQRGDEHVRSGLTTFERCNVVDPGVADAVGLDVRWGQLDRVIWLRHAAIPVSEGQGSTILHAIGPRVTPGNARRTGWGACPVPERCVNSPGAACIRRRAQLGTSLAA